MVGVSGYLVPVRQGNQRETSGRKAIDYSNAVIDFMDHQGYFLDARAEDSGEHEDLVFLPKAGNRASVVAEAKYRSPESDGFSPNDYVEGFAKRFYQWEQGAYQGYDFYLFASKSANSQLWLDLFRRLKEEDINSFFEKMKSQADGDLAEFLERHDPSRFRRFLENSYIWIDYYTGDFERITQRNERTGEYGYDPYAINYEPIPESGDHKTNLLQVTNLPSDLFRIPAADGLSTRKFYSHKPHDVLPIHFHQGEIFSLIHPDSLDEETREMCSHESHQTVPFEEFAVREPSSSDIDVSKVLIRGVVSTIADQVGAVVNRERRDTRVYMEHEHDDIKIDGQWMTKQLDTGEVRHRSVSIFVKFFNKGYYIGLFPTVEYTRDGRNLVSGRRKKYLSDRFNTGKFPQNRRKSQTVELWLSELALLQSLARFGLPSNLQSVQVQRVDDLVLDGIRPPSSGEERNELVQDQLAKSIEEVESG